MTTASRVEHFVRTVVAPYERDPCCGAHGPCDELVQELRGLARAAGGDGIALRQEDIAAMIGVSRQTLNKALKAMEREGVIALEYARIRVVDAEGLRRLGKG